MNVFDQPNFKHPDSPFTVDGSGLVAGLNADRLDGYEAQDIIDLISGGGVAGPGTTTDNAIARWDGITGAAIKNSGVLLGDTGILTAFGVNVEFVGLIDSDTSQYLTMVCGEDLSEDRTLSIVVNDASCILTIAGNVTISGTNSGDQTISLTGDVTGSGTGSFSTTIAAGVVTYAKLQDASAANVVLARAAGTAGDYGEVAIAASQLLGRGDSGNIAAITLGSNLSMSGTTLNAAGGSGAAGSDTQIQFNDGGSALGGDADLTWDKTNNIFNVGGVTATTKGILNANQPSTRPALLLVGTGTGAGSPSSTSAGIAMWMTWNNTNNRQFVIANSDNFGDPETGCFRYLTGSGMPNLDGITGDGNTRTHVCIGTATSGAVIGGEGLAYNASLPGKLSVYAQASQAAFHVRHGSSGTSHLAEWSNNAGTPLSVITSTGNFGVLQTTVSAYLHLGAGTASAGTAPMKLSPGTNLATEEDGALEYDGSHLYFTIGTTRHQLDQQSGSSGLTHPQVLARGLGA